MEASIQMSQAQYAARISSWVTFSHAYGIHPLEPAEDDVLGWVGLFTNGRSAKTYVTALRWLFARMRVPITWDTPSLQLLLRGSVKLSPAVKRAPAISGRWTASLALYAWRRREFDNYLLAVLAFSFGFRVKAELLPLCFDELAEGGHSSLAIFRDEQNRLVLRIWLRRRKNAPEGAVLTRACTCRSSQVMCPVHALVRWMSATGKERQVGRLFPKACYSSFSRGMSFLLEKIGFPQAADFSSHGFRRGMAQEILRRGGSLADVLAAGGWRSPAFLLYLDRNEVDEAAILDFLLEEDLGTARFEAPLLAAPLLSQAPALQAAALPDDVLALLVPPATCPEPSNAPPAPGSVVLDTHPRSPAPRGRFSRAIANPPSRSVLAANVASRMACADVQNPPRDAFPSADWFDILDVSFVPPPASSSPTLAERAVEAPPSLPAPPRAHVPCEPACRPVESDCARSALASALGAAPLRPFEREISPSEVIPPCLPALLDEEPQALLAPEISPNMLRSPIERDRRPARAAPVGRGAKRTASGQQKPASDKPPQVGARRACRFLKPSSLNPSMADWLSLSHVAEHS